jgi:hypothetical protein
MNQVVIGMAEEYANLIPLSSVASHIMQNIDFEANA